MYTEYLDLVEYLEEILDGVTVRMGRDREGIPEVTVVPVGDSQIEEFSEDMSSAHDGLEILISFPKGREGEAMGVFETLLTKLPSYKAHKGFDPEESYTKDYVDTDVYQIRIRYRIALLFQNTD